jgi:hypothetical protein
MDLTTICVYLDAWPHCGAPVRDVESPAKTYFHQYLQHTQKFQAFIVNILAIILSIYLVLTTIQKLQFDLLAKNL